VKIHHLNCGTLCPFSFMKLGNKIFGDHHHVDAEMVCHCLLIEDRKNLILIDTGLGINDVEGKRSDLASRVFQKFAMPLLKREETAVEQIKKLGFKAKDVTHIIATHFDLDHVGGIDDFPNARIHLLRDEYEAIVSPRNLNERLRYPKHLMSSVKNISLYHDTNENGQTWNGFTAISNLAGIDVDIFLIPLPGHTRGHAGVVIDQKIFFVGDAVLSLDQLKNEKKQWWVDIYNQKSHVNKALYDQNVSRLKELFKLKNDIRFHCSHDKADFFKCV
jgi:glyoxylase-like metal-dependent hydrolase (beta-lactamase superfamily II)